MCVLLCVFTACVLGEGVEMFSWLDGHSFIFRLGETHRNRIRRVPLVRTFDGSLFFGKRFHK